MEYRELNLDQKRELLKREYLKDGAEESFVDELIPSNPTDLDNRLINVFGYTADSEVEL